MYPTFKPVCARVMTTAMAYKADGWKVLQQNWNLWVILAIHQ